MQQPPQNYGQPNPSMAGSQGPFHQPIPVMQPGAQGIHAQP